VKSAKASLRKIRNNDFIHAGFCHKLKFAIRNTVNDFMNILDTLKLAGDEKLIMGEI